MKKVIVSIGVTAVVIVVVGLCIWERLSTKTIRQYKARNEELKLIVERSTLELAALENAVKLKKYQITPDPNS